MPFVPAFYKDLGKSLGDLFHKQFDLKHSISTKNSAEGGFTVETGAKGSCAAADGHTKLSYKASDYSVDAEAHTADHAKTKITAKFPKLVKGVELSVDGSFVPDATVTAKYSQDHLAVQGALKCSEFSSLSLDVSAVVGYEGLSLGGTASLDLFAGPDISNYDVAAQYTSGDWFVMAKTVKHTDVYTGVMNKAAMENFQLGAGLHMSLKDQNDRTLVVASEYKLNDSLTIKAKADSSFVATVAVEHRLSDPNVKVNWACQVDTQGDGPSKWGLGLAFGDY